MTTVAPEEVEDRPRMSPWDRFLFEPQSTSPITLVRVAWGAVMVLWSLSLLPDVDPLLRRDALGYGRDLADGSWSLLRLFDWDGAPLTFCLILLVASVATMVGYRTRLASAVAVLCLISLLRENSTVFNSGDLALRLVGISVALAPSGLLLSVDSVRARRADRGPAPHRAPWALRLLQLHIALGYLLSAWGKVRGSTWREGTAVGESLRIVDLQRFVPPEWFFDQSALLAVLTWGSLAFEATFLFLVWNRKLRPWVLGAGVLLHLTIHIFLDVGFFSYAMWIGYLAFVPPEVADRIVGRWDPVGVGLDAEHAVEPESGVTA